LNEKIREFFKERALLFNFSVVIEKSIPILWIPLELELKGIETKSKNETQ
jgi:hypothetical protein